MIDQPLFDYDPFADYEGTTDPVEIVAQAKEQFNPIGTYILSSGGNDSMVLLDYMASRIDFDAVLHINTGTGVKENGIAITTEFLRDHCEKANYPFIELTPPRSYEEAFIENPVINGLPGPGMHRISYVILKERPLKAFTKTIKKHRLDKVMFLTGIRSAESRNRMGYKSQVVDRRGSWVWVNPIYFWDNDKMKKYRADHNLPQNPVAEHIHISGECLCGAFAKPGELEELRFFFPETAKRIENWEKRCEEKGLKYCRWGARRSDSEEGESYMCTQCVGQMEMFDENN
jgi:3'-phosphoadenosine 5'-phosphosulfate sulfotransferase (PAPS reductase)/FAD synthetase